MIYDCIIIGAGPAGLTAGIYLGRYQRSTLILTENVGGQTAIAGTIENYPGFEEINGAKLVGEMQKKVNNLEKITLKIAQSVESIINKDAVFEVTTKNESFHAKTILIACGKRHRELGIENEKYLIGKGLSYCATCDGTFANGKEVVVIGGGYAATEAALILEKLAKKITIIVLNKNLNGEKVTIDKITDNPNITIVNNAKTDKILTENGFVSAVSITDTTSNEKRDIPCQMAFVEIGQIPNTEKFADLVKLNDQKEIEINNKNYTSSKGVFAAGDITSISAKQTIVACGEGAKAAVEINRYLDAMVRT